MFVICSWAIWVSFTWVTLTKGSKRFISGSDYIIPSSGKHRLLPTLGLYLKLLFFCFFYNYTNFSILSFKTLYSQHHSSQCGSPVTALTNINAMTTSDTFHYSLETIYIQNITLYQCYILLRLTKSPATAVSYFSGALTRVITLFSFMSSKWKSKCFGVFLSKHAPNQIHRDKGDCFLHGGRKIGSPS